MGLAGALASPARQTSTPTGAGAGLPCAAAGSAVFLGRWTVFFRAVMPALAGVSRMPYRRFLIWNAAGGDRLLGSSVVVVGYLAGLATTVRPPGSVGRPPSWR